MNYDTFIFFIAISLWFHNYLMVIFPLILYFSLDIDFFAGKKRSQWMLMFVVVCCCLMLLLEISYTWNKKNTQYYVKTHALASNTIHFLKFSIHLFLNNFCEKCLLTSNFLFYYFLLFFSDQLITEHIHKKMFHTPILVILRLTLF